MNNYLYTTYDCLSVKSESPETLIKLIQDSWKKYGKDKVSFEVDYETEYDSTNATAYLKCERSMTAKEKKDFDTTIETQRKRQEQYQRKQYEELKKKFGG